MFARCGPCSNVKLPRDSRTSSLIRSFVALPESSKMDGELEIAIRIGDLPGVKLLVQGGVRIEETSKSDSALEYAAVHGKILIVEWLLAEGGKYISEVNKHGFTTLLSAAGNWNLTNDHLQTIGWLLEHRGADITDTTPAGDTVWDLIEMNCGFADFGNDVADDDLTALLRVVVLQGAPPTDLMVRMSLQHSRRARDTAARGAPSIPRTAAGTPCRAHVAHRTAPGPGQQLRGARDDRGALGHRARRSGPMMCRASIKRPEIID
jgi:hypothetical protein